MFQSSTLQGVKPVVTCSLLAFAAYNGRDVVNTHVKS